MMNNSSAASSLPVDHPGLWARICRKASGYLSKRRMNRSNRLFRKEAAPILQGEWPGLRNMTALQPEELKGYRKTYAKSPALRTARKVIGNPGMRQALDDLLKRDVLIHRGERLPEELRISVATGGQADTHELAGLLVDRHVGDLKGSSHKDADERGYSMALIKAHQVVGELSEQLTALDAPGREAASSYDRAVYALHELVGASLSRIIVNHARMMNQPVPHRTLAAEDAAAGLNPGAETSGGVNVPDVQAGAGPGPDAGAGPEV